MDALDDVLAAAAELDDRPGGPALGAIGRKLAAVGPGLNAAELAAVRGGDPRRILGRHPAGPVVALRYYEPGYVSTVHHHAWTVLVPLEGDSRLERWCAGVGGARFAGASSSRLGHPLAIAAGEPHRQVVGRHGAVELVLIGDYSETRPTVDLEPAVADAAAAAFVGEFVESWARGDATALAPLYAQDAFADVHVPRWRTQVDGHEKVLNMIGREEFLPGFRLGDWTARSTLDGFVVELEAHFSPGGKPGMAQMVVLARTRDGQIYDHTVYCTGIWDQATMDGLAASGGLVARVTLLERVTQRAAIEGHDGRSGARIERATLDDGTPVIVKTASPANDITIAATGGVDRERLLWESGVLRRVGNGVGHAILEITRQGETTITVMRDVGASIPGWTRTVSRQECRRIVDALAALHATFLGDAPDAACELETRIGLLGPGTIERAAGPEHSLVGAIAKGWECFFDAVHGDVAEAVASIHADASTLAEAMRRCGPTTLTHADAWLVNLALEPDAVVLLDWALPTDGPPALDLAVFLTGSAAHVEPTREQVIEMFRAASPSTDAAAVDLALLFGLADMGWNKALDASGHEDPAMRAREQADLDWWLDRARTTLDRGLL